MLSNFSVCERAEPLQLPMAAPVPLPCRATEPVRPLWLADVQVKATLFSVVAKAAAQRAPFSTDRRALTTTVWAVPPTWCGTSNLNLLWSAV